MSTRDAFGLAAWPALRWRKELKGEEGGRILDVCVC